MTTCREELLAAAADLTTRSGAVFTLDEIVREMARRGSSYPEATIRTHVSSIMCKHAPHNHGVHFDDFERVGRGKYVLLKRGTVAPSIPRRSAPGEVVIPVEAPAGSSRVQREAEDEVLSLLVEELRIPLAPQKVPLPDGSRVEIDAMSFQPPVLAEIWAHQGPAKGGQRGKVLTDVLKLVYVEHCLGVAFRKIVCFTDAEARELFMGKSWYAGAIRHYGVEMLLIDIPSDLRDKILAAQKLQYR